MPFNPSLNDTVLNGSFLFDTEQRGEISLANGGTPLITNSQCYCNRNIATFFQIRILDNVPPSDIALFGVDHTPSLQEGFGGIKFLSHISTKRTTVTHFRLSHG